jgi:hypothetical protein
VKYMSPKYRPKGVILGDPSRMTERAVWAYLSLWQKRQKNKKTFPLLFILPEAVRVAENRAKKGKGKRVESQDSSESEGDDKGDDSAQSGGEVDDGDGDNGEKDGDMEMNGGMGEAHGKRPERSGEDIGGQDDDGGQPGGADGSVDRQQSKAPSEPGEDVPAIPSTTGNSKSKRLRYLKSLCDDSAYKGLLKLLAVATVCI